jgi:hypothetical protein
MEVSYCEGWFRHFKKITGLLSEEEAKTREKNREVYTVIIGDHKHPFGFIEINKGFYGVGFLDDYIREYLNYIFVEQMNGLLFLNEVKYTEFEGNTDNILKNTYYWFTPDGNVKIGKSKPPFQKVEVIEKKVDVSRNWEKKPEFGKYENLIKKDR